MEAQLSDEPLWVRGDTDGTRPIQLLPLGSQAKVAGKDESVLIDVSSVRLGRYDTISDVNIVSMNELYRM